MNKKDLKTLNWKTLRWIENTFALNSEFNFQYPIEVGTVDQAAEYLRNLAWDEVYEVIGARIHTQAKPSNLAEYIGAYFDEIEWEKAAVKIASQNNIQLKGRPGQLALLEAWKIATPQDSKEELPLSAQIAFHDQKLHKLYEMERELLESEQQLLRDTLDDDEQRENATLIDLENPE